MTNKDCGSRIRDLRENKRIEKNGTSKKMTQDDLADLLHTDRWTVADIENGKVKKLKLEQINDLCDFFQCDADYLLCRIDQKTRVTTDICQATGLAPEAAEILHNIASTLATGLDIFFYRQILDSLNLLIGDVSALDAGQKPVLCNIYNMIHADQLSISTSRPGFYPDPGLPDMYVYNTQTYITEGTLEQEDFKNMLRESLKTQIFDQLRQIGDREISKERDH